MRPIAGVRPDSFYKIETALCTSRGDFDAAAELETGRQLPSWFYLA